MVEERRSGEVNAGGGGGVLMALQTLVLWWERRGQHLLQEGKRRSNRGGSVPMRWRWPEASGCVVGSQRQRRLQERGDDFGRAEVGCYGKSDQMSSRT
jgi:hypothetical protein